tara:strand:- start:871 stop:1188 length:318 start_codon:yes stop_codon:yes gene_type:complete
MLRRTNAAVQHITKWNIYIPNKSLTFSYVSCDTIPTLTKRRKTEMARHTKVDQVVDDKPEEEVQELTGMDPIHEEDLDDFFCEFIQSDRAGYQDVLDKFGSTKFE